MGAPQNELRMESLKAKEKWAQLTEAEHNAKNLRGELFRCGFEDSADVFRGAGWV
jgi:hypothetical protein